MAEPMEFDQDNLPLDYYPLLEDGHLRRKSVLISMPDRTTNYGRADLDLLEKLWRDKFQCVVVPIVIPTINLLKQKLDDIVQVFDREPQWQDYFGLTFIGHDRCSTVNVAGVDYYHEYIKLSGGATITVQELQRKDYTSNCPVLAGKVKQFYINACRGFRI